MSISAVTSAQHKPTIGLCMDASSSTRLAPLVGALAEFATPLAPEANQILQARLASSVHAPTAHLVLDHPEVPAAVIIHEEDDLTHPVAQAAQALVVIDGGALWNALQEDPVVSERALLLSSIAVAAPFPLPVSVPQRATLRKRSGFEDHLVIPLDRPDTPKLGDTNMATALRVASVVVASGETAAQAMALATPVVTDEFTAKRFGASHGTHVLVAKAHETLAVANALAKDEFQMAALGTAGRALIYSIQPRAVAKAIVQRFNLTCASAWPGAVNARFGTRLAEIGTPPGHPIETQFEDRLRGLSMHVQAGGL